MRREWSAWIKNRDWGAFEAEAKRDPSQILADTVAELERGFDTKPDRRALRKVLYLLLQAGIEPSPIDPVDEEESRDASDTFAAGLLASADGEGCSWVVYGEQSGDKVLWLETVLHATDGIVDAAERTTPVEEAETTLERYRHTPRPPIVCGPVPPEYALSRIAGALGRQKGRAPSVVAYWGKILSRAEEAPHPADSLAAADATEKQRFQLALEVLPALPWRLELGSASPLLVQLYEDREANKDRGEKETQAARDALVAGRRAALFTQEVVADHALRLRDLAWITHTRAPEDAAVVLATALDLEARGAESDYARAVMEKTLYMLFESIREARERERAEANA
ncbi:MAG: hypothetical protein M9921_07655 [Fimbriimonadaceae bacterium]|nr:hypothetical protein [Fimbriimonadaceae bacterium]